MSIQMAEEEICKRFKRNGCYKEHIKKSIGDQT